MCCTQLINFSFFHLSPKIICLKVTDIRTIFQSNFKYSIYLWIAWKVFFTMLNLNCQIKIWMLILYHFLVSSISSQNGREESSFTMVFIIHGRNMPTLERFPCIWKINKYLWLSRQQSVRSQGCHWRVIDPRPVCYLEHWIINIL